ncbi:hypothetical protein ANME2D_02563 [Candidatus Methanoperedens nitroreducens]|uniref:Uncharacterized protein n=1 Tax=Candidatus Methanoperedens nitratireducens TaxID=1392998 RepID=A0A062V1P2_9EURY|nr:hypothetical protein [Candidatus Methanoperedens nitroreducens]KCZ70543.1 hypothetical protein ANME2D_02563 [Candidatus Methanoperedens nitroreducens]MDJ1420395.1 hypothetical protein [Candidatus Methanoperedens sp.]
MVEIDPKKVKRMRYFDGLFLKQEEFNLEQNYHIRMRRLHNRHLHGWGIVWGLDVAKKDPTTVTIKEGMALDRVKAKSYDGIYEEDVSQEIVLTKDTDVNLSSSTSNYEYIYISYHQEESDVVEEKGGDKKIHWSESALIEHGDKPGGEEKIILAKVVLKDNADNTGKIVDSIVYSEGNIPLRTYAGAYGRLTLPNEKDSSNLPYIEGMRSGSLNGIQINSGITNFTGALSVEGNVGIGTTTPSERLEINGTVKATAFAGDGSKLTGINTSRWSDAPGGIYYNKGNIGIGTQAPGFRFHQVGGDHVIEDSDISLRRNGLHRWKIQELQNTGFRITQVHDNADKLLNLARFEISDAGNVGIGTPSPNAKLEVNGTVKATAFVGDGSKLTGISASKWSDAVTPAGSIYYDKGSVGIGTANPTWKLHVKTGMSDGGLLVESGTWPEILFVQTGGKSWRAGHDGNNFRIRVWQGSSLGFQDRIVATYDGNIGIGTTTPSERLEITGTVKATVFVGDGSKLTGISTGAGQWSDAPGGIYYNKGNVGIGTLSPGFRFHQVGGDHVIEDSDISLRRNGFHRWKIQELQNTGFRITQVYDNTDKLLNLARFEISDAGNVGIGTAAPSHKFHVLAPDAVGLFESTGSQAYLRLSTNEGLNNRVEITNRPGGRLSLWTAGAGDVFNITRDGKVGIGTTTPSERLEINGNMVISGEIIQESWIAPALENGWQKYDAIYNPPGYFRDKNGIVHLRGMVKMGGIGTSIFTLPKGYRPEYRELQPVQTNPNAIGRCDILPDGKVVASGGNNGWFSLDGITFLAKKEIILKPIPIEPIPIEPIPIKPIPIEPIPIDPIRTGPIPVIR